VNLLSFGPDTEAIELRPLNILIGPNGSGKSNLIDIVGLLGRLPDKDPWVDVIATGGADEWVWKGRGKEFPSPSISIETNVPTSGLASLYGTAESQTLSYVVSVWPSSGGFAIENEKFIVMQPGSDNADCENSAFDRVVWESSRSDSFHALLKPLMAVTNKQELRVSQSVLSQLNNALEISAQWPAMRDLANSLEHLTCYRDWTFGREAKPRQLQRVGLDSYHLAPDSGNIAQVLKAMRDRGESANFERLIELMKAFYEPVKDVDTELVGTHLRIMIKEEGLGSRTPADRLSDGTLRWLNLLIILLDPTPPPVICIEEPELGLHPDMIPTLADLLRDASTRTQLIVTTHSDALLDAFSETPEDVCVCEKIDGSTVIRRLDREQLKIWSEKYSLGHLWTSGEIGGNRW